MKGIILSTLTLGDKKYDYNSINDGIVQSKFAPDKFYGGRVQRFGKTSEGLYLCLEKNMESVIDIFVDFNTLDKLSSKVLFSIAAKVKAKKLAYTPIEEREDMDKVLKITPKMDKDDLIKFIKENAVEVLMDSNEPEEVTPKQEKTSKTNKGKVAKEDEKEEDDENPDNDEGDDDSDNDNKKPVGDGITDDTQTLQGTTKEPGF